MASSWITLFCIVITLDNTVFELLAHIWHIYGHYWHIDGHHFKSNSTETAGFGALQDLLLLLSEEGFRDFREIHCLKFEHGYNFVVQKLILSVAQISSTNGPADEASEIFWREKIQISKICVS